MGQIAYDGFRLEQTRRDIRDVDDHQLGRAAAQLRALRKGWDIAPPAVTQRYEPALDGFLKHAGLHRMVASQSLLAANFSGLFAAPRALRHLIETYDISARGRVEVLYIGVGVYETFDQGRWFSLYEQLVPAGRSVKITGIGMDFTDDMLVMETPFARLCDLKRHAASCVERVHVSSLGEAFQ